MARTPIAARNHQDPSYSEGYLGQQSPDSIDSILGGEDGFRSPIDSTSRTPSHIRFGDIEPESNQLALIPIGHGPISGERVQAFRSLGRYSVFGRADAHCKQTEKRNSRCSRAKWKYRSPGWRDEHIWDKFKWSVSSIGITKDGPANNGFTPHYASTLDKSCVGIGQCTAYCDSGPQSAGFKVFQYRYHEF